MEGFGGIEMNWEEIWKLLRQQPIQRDISHRIRAVEHETGRVTTAYWYACAYPDKAEGYMGEVRKELGDIIAMIRMLCQRMNWNYDEIELNGQKDLMKFITERMCI